MLAQREQEDSVAVAPMLWEELTAQQIQGAVAEAILQIIQVAVRADQVLL